MAFNLIRNSRVFFTTNVNAVGIVQTTGFTATNTFEIQVQDGFSFSQNTSSETVTLNEAGPAPVRGQQSFNTSLDPVDFSMSTYIRPKRASTVISCEERVLWNALAGVDAIGGSNPAWADGTTTPSVTPAILDFDGSNAHQLQKFGLLIVVDQVCYIIDNAAMDQATVDFGIDAIGMIAWTGKGTALRQLTGVVLTDGATVAISGTLTGVAKIKDTTARYIANKLTTLTFKAGIGGTGTTYNIAITGGSVTIANNITYLTPSNLGTVNAPIGYFTGTRSVSGSLTAYLRTGSGTTATLLADMLANSATTSQTKFQVIVALGGATTADRIELDMSGAALTIPTISSEQVISTTINFTAQAYNGSNYDLEATNELVVRYFAG